MWKWISKSLSARTKKEPELERVRPADGSVRIDGQRLLVTDPEPGGRFPVLAPSPGVLLRLGGAPLSEPSPVTTADQVEWELAAEADVPFFTIHVAEDGMEASLEILGDPHWAVDGAVLQQLGEGTWTLVAAAVEKSRRRPQPPDEQVREGLRQAGVSFGIDEKAIAKALEQGAKGWRGSVVIAHGQAAKEPIADRWEWVQAHGLATPGQVVARYYQGAPNTPAITVDGAEQFPHPDVSSPTITLGPGLRLLGSGEVVATRRGLTRLVDQPDGERWASVVEAEVAEHPAPGATLETAGDLAVIGDVIKVKIKAGGSVLITGKATESEIHGQSIEIMGRAESCKLWTVPPGSVGPLTGFLRLFQRQIAALAASPRDYIGPFRRAQATLQYANDLLRSLPPFEESLKELIISITRVLMAGPEASPPSRMAELAAEMDRFCTRSEAGALTGGGVTLGDGGAACEVWSADRILIQGTGLHACRLFSLGDVFSAEGAVIAQTDILAARQVVIHGATAKRRPVTIRAGGRVTIAEAGEGTVVELGGQKHQFRNETLWVTIGLSHRYEITVRLQ